MVKQSLVCVGAVLGVLVLAGGAAAGASDDAGRAACACAIDVSDALRITDAPTGLVLSTVRHASGAVTYRASGRGLEVEKTLAPNGTFSLSLWHLTDRVELSGSAALLKVSRQGQAVDLRPVDSEEHAVQRAATLLAGSPAIRLFRVALGRMAASTLASEPGLALQFGDALLRVIQDDAPGGVALVRRHAGQTMTASQAGVRVVSLAGGAVSAAAGGDESCFQAWKRQVMEAWVEYEACYYDFSWYSGGRLGCAFLYVIEVESAWFKMLSCSSIKIT